MSKNNVEDGRHRLNVTRSEMNRLTTLLNCRPIEEITKEDRFLSSKIQLILVKIEYKDKKPDYVPAQKQQSKPIEDMTPWEEYDYTLTTLPESMHEMVTKPDFPRPE